MPVWLYCLLVLFYRTYIGMIRTQNRESDAAPQAVYDQIVHSVVAHLREAGFSSVRANQEGFASPARVQWDDEDEGVVPDIIGEHNGALYVFEIETRDQIEANNVKDRWRLLSVYAKRHNGKFYLVIPETKAGYLRAFAKDLGVRPEFLKLSGID